MKEVMWLGSSLDDLKSFSKDAKARAGYEIFSVQSGLKPSDWKPMPGIGAGVEEIRIRGKKEHRVIYVAKFEKAVYVLHCFAKKTRKTPRKDIDLAKERYGHLLRMKK